MIRAFWIGCLATLAGLVATPTDVLAAGKTHAILIGVGNYSDTQIQSRQNAVADAQALYDLFTAKASLGAAPDDIHLFLSQDDPKRNAKPATKENILAAVKSVVANAKKDDTFLFGFFGQGAILADRTCLLVADSTFKDRAKNSIATADLENEFKDIKVEKLVAFVDMNFKGIDAGKEAMLEPNTMDILRVFVGSEDKEEHTLPPGRVTFLANGNVTQPIELKDHSLFAQVVIDGLKGAADKEGYEPDGIVTVDELNSYIEKEVVDQSRKSAKSKEEKLQAPVSWGGRTNRFTITRNPDAYAKAKTRLEKLAKAELPEDVAAQGQALLEKMPRLKADQELRKRFQQFSDGGISKDELLAARTQNMDARKLSQQDASSFAKKVMEGMLIVRSGYVKDTELSDMVTWAVKGMYKQLELNMPDDVKERLAGLKELKRGKLEEFLAEVRTKFGQREDLEGNKDVDMALFRTLLNLDFPYTTYIDKESRPREDSQFLGRFTGIGIQIRRDFVRDGLLVVSPIKGSPGYKAGLQAGDLVTEIVTDMDEKGQPQPNTQVISTKGMSSEDAVKRILGKAGTKVKVIVQREGVDKPLEFEISRGKVEVETVLGARRLEDDSWDYMLDPKSKIGYIRLTQFTHTSSADMEAAVKKLNAAGVKGLILDLRFNPGGLLDSAVEICDLFIDDGVIVSIRPRGTREKFITGTHEGSVLNFPLVCLVNGNSASGSEIVSACLQDHKRAVIVGERSYGKGSVQTIHQFRPVDAEIKMTTATFWRPNGKNLNKPSTSGSEAEDWGVRPDDGFELKLDRKEMVDLFERLRDQEIIARRDGKAKEPKPAFKDKQLEMGLDYLHSQLKTAAREPTKKAG